MGEQPSKERFIRTTNPKVKDLFIANNITHIVSYDYFTILIEKNLVPRFIWFCFENDGVAYPRDDVNILNFSTYWKILVSLAYMRRTKRLCLLPLLPLLPLPPLLPPIIQS